MTEVAEAPAKTKQEQNAEAALAKIAAKEAKLKAKQEAAEAREAEKAAKAAAREAIKQAREAERAAAASEPKAPRERTYDGSMLALADKVRAGVYVKGVNGQLRSTDELAIALESVPAKRMVPLLLEVLQIRASENPYAALNYGQQSMNLRNRLRGAIRKGAEVKVIDATSDADTVKITLDYVKEVRDAGGYTAEATKPAVEEKVDATA